MTTKLLASITVFVLLTGVISTSMMQFVYAASSETNDKAIADKKALDAKKAADKKALDAKKAADKKALDAKKAADAKMAPGKTTSSSMVTVDMAKDSGTNTICADKCYAPSTVQIKIGGTVTWKNVDALPHTVTSQKVPTPDLSFDSGMITTGGSFNHKFDKTGTYDYYCMVHPWMIGKVTVS